jgi:hypothetical protein
MSVGLAILVGLGMGAVFGLALEKSRVFEPGAIISQMQLRTFLMMKIFLTAVATGLVILALLNGVMGVKMAPKGLVWSADIVGGLVLGAGIAIAGACPGTAFAQLGAGYRDAWFIVAGGIVGAMVFGYLEPVLKPVLLSGGPGRVTIDKVLGVPFWAMALGLAAVLVAALVALERYKPWREEIGADVDGLGAARTTSATASPPGTLRPAAGE